MDDFDFSSSNKKSERRYIRPMPGFNDNNPLKSYNQEDAIDRLYRSCCKENYQLFKSCFGKIEDNILFGVICILRSLDDEYKLKKDWIPLFPIFRSFKRRYEEDFETEKYDDSICESYRPLDMENTKDNPEDNTEIEKEKLKKKNNNGDGDAFGFEENRKC